MKDGTTEHGALEKSKSFMKKKILEFYKPFTHFITINIEFSPFARQKNIPIRGIEFYFINFRRAAVRFTHTKLGLLTRRKT